MATKHPTRTAPKVELTLMIAGMLISVWGKRTNDQEDRKAIMLDICNAEGLLFRALVLGPVPVHQSEGVSAVPVQLFDLESYLARILLI
jgi:hypothetical protein